MPNFDCGGERCGRFSCSSCTDEKTQAEYWNLLRTVRDDYEAEKIMRERLAKKRARATKAHDEATRLRAENERLRAALADIARGDYSDPLCQRTPEQRARDALAGK